MRHVRDALSDQDRAEIERAVAEVESRSTAQVVVALAGKSGHYQRASDLFGLVLALVALALAWSLWQRFGPNPEPWETGTVPTLGLGWTALILVAWFLIGAAAADHWPMLARPFMTKAEREAAVRRSGAEAFRTLRIGSTRSGCAVLVFVSLFERIVWVCPDDAVASKIPPNAWPAVSAVVAEGFRSGAPGSALARAVLAAGRVLTEHFPRQAGSAVSNELPDQVRFVSDGGGDAGA